QRRRRRSPLSHPQLQRHPKRPKRLKPRPSRRHPPLRHRRPDSQQPRTPCRLLRTSRPTFSRRTQQRCLSRVSIHRNDLAPAAFVDWLVSTLLASSQCWTAVPNRDRFGKKTRSETTVGAALSKLKISRISREKHTVLTVSGYFNSVDHVSGTPLASYPSQSQ